MDRSSGRSRTPIFSCCQSYSRLLSLASRVGGFKTYLRTYSWNELMNSNIENRLDRIEKNMATQEDVAKLIQMMQERPSWTRYLGNSIFSALLIIGFVVLLMLNIS